MHLINLQNIIKTPVAIGRLQILNEATIYCDTI